MKVLVIAPHNDDEILGVGGTIKKHINNGDDVFVCEVTSGPKYKLMQEEARNAHHLLGVKKSIFLNQPVVRLRDLEQGSLNAEFVRVVESLCPEIVYIPFVGDMHLDHREVTDCAMVALRPINGSSVREIYMYETLSETGWNLPMPDKSFMPNCWIDITDTFDDKVRAMESYQSQIKAYPHPRSIESIRALAMYRGSTIGVQFAESFMLVRKIG